MLPVAATLGAMVASVPIAHASTSTSPQVIRIAGASATAVVVDPAGNAYLAGSSVVKLNPQGAVVWRTAVSANAVAVDAAGNVYAAGSSPGDILVVKLGPDGIEQWRQRYDNGGLDIPNRIAVDGSGNVYASGISEGDGFDWVTLKVGPQGTLQWVRRLSSAGLVEDIARDMALAPNGDVVVAGTVNIGDTVTNDTLVVTYDAQGNTVWQRQFSATAISDEDVGDIDIDTNGRITVSASSAPNSNPEFGQPLRAPLSLQYDQSGALIRTISAGGNAVDVDSAGDAYLAGFFQVAGASAVAKYDANGNRVWSTPLTVGPNENLIVSAVAVDSQGVLTFAGTVTDNTTLKTDYLTIRYGTDGAELWRHRFDGTGNADNVAGLAIDGQDAALVAGSSANSISPSDSDIVALKFPAGLTPSTTPPAAPGQLAATAVSRSQIRLTWSDNSSDENGFRVERCRGVGCTNFTEIAVVAANTSTFLDSGLARNTSYTYRVRAFNDAGQSAFSNTATVKTGRS
jgi:hypothetical protein